MSTDYFKADELSSRHGKAYPSHHTSQTILQMFKPRTLSVALNLREYSGPMIMHNPGFRILVHGENSRLIIIPVIHGTCMAH